MPVTAGPVPGLTSGLRRVPIDPGRFHSGRWFLLAEGVLVSAFGIAGLVSAALHPHAGPTGVPVLGLASTPSHSGMLLAFGVVAIAAVGSRRAAVTVTALSAVAYTMLLFVSSVATARRMPTPLGFHAADIVLHGVLAVVNLALLMWLIPDELGDPIWVPRRRQARGRDRRQPSASEAITEPAAVSPSMVSATKPASPAAAAARAQESGAHAHPPQHPVAHGQPGHPGSTNSPIGVGPARRGRLGQSRSQETNQPSAHNVGNSTQVNLAARATDAVLSRGAVVPVAVVLAVVVGIVIWIRRR